MRRREYVRTIGGATSVTILGGLAGCSVDGGSGGDGGPFSITMDGPFHTVKDEDYAIYTRMTFDNPPAEWPEGNRYQTWIKRKDDSQKSPMTAIYEFTNVTNFQLRKSYFENDETLTTNIHLAGKNFVSAGTTFVFSVSKPDSNDSTTLGELTYQGEEEPRALEKPPSWAE